VAAADGAGVGVGGDVGSRSKGSTWPFICESHVGPGFQSFQHFGDTARFPNAPDRSLEVRLVTVTAGGRGSRAVTGGQFYTSSFPFISTNLLLELELRTINIVITDHHIKIIGD
jgi:hypothetical protein